ncbi:MAG TPA: beta-ketoacyl-[acyl-carrier-protein] synthase family protein [Planctomycetaceae bacterium]|nr:beta-ketoacyl-[acyl-carrier-protein] synthase family protein [Planctomycetaceae bacterium]
MTRSCESPRRVVITGAGVLSPLGIGYETFGKNLLEGRSGISRLESVPYSGAPHNVGGEIKDFTETTAKNEYLKKQRKSIKVMCREIQFGVASASLAIEHAGLDLEAIDHERFGVDFGANLMFSPPEVLKDPCWLCVDEADAEFHFKHEQWGTKGLSNLEPLWLLRYLPNMPACHIGIYAEARGPSNSITVSEASGNLAVAEAFHVIMRGLADTMIAGTTGTRIHPVKSMHAALWDILADHGDEPPETWSRPFDKTRMGEVLAEGACSFILEEEQHALARGAKPLGRILGAGSSCAFESNGPHRVTRAIVNAVRAALRDAGVTPADVGHINAHGLGTPWMDADEAQAIHEIFGPAAETVPVTALKSVLANSGAGCGTLELAGSLVGLQQGVVPVTKNYRVPDPDCRLNVVHGRVLPVTNRLFVNINVTTVGQAAALVVEGI